ncbi:MAG: hypothetical protein BWK80_21365 [Desulfobacteraceae bacterium IS3]|nr:MAG: hypothetical protein BWK80_21365 [Desulfobacteraceae bacterium IS3]
MSRKGAERAKTPEYRYFGIGKIWLSVFFSLRTLRLCETFFSDFYRASYYGEKDNSYPKKEQIRA